MDSAEGRVAAETAAATAAVSAAGGRVAAEAARAAAFAPFDQNQKSNLPPQLLVLDLWRSSSLLERLASCSASRGGLRRSASCCMSHATRARTRTRAHMPLLSMPKRARMLCCHLWAHAARFLFCSWHAHFEGCGDARVHARAPIRLVGLLLARLARLSRLHRLDLRHLSRRLVSARARKRRGDVSAERSTCASRRTRVQRACPARSVRACSVRACSVRACSCARRRAERGAHGTESHVKKCALV